MVFEVLFYDGWSDPPAYLPVDVVEGETVEGTLKKNLANIIAEVRKLLGIEESELSDEAICEALYLVPADALIPVRRFVTDKA